MNFAILGTGIVADYHKTAILNNQDLGAQLIAVSHYDPSRFAAISDQFSVPCIDFDELLSNDDVDCVCICTPSGQHAEQAIALARAGKHLVIEKPIALSESDAEEMVAVAHENDVILTVAYQRRTEPVFHAVKNAIRAGDLGEITLASITLPYFRGDDYYNLAPWRGTWELDGGGVLMNQGIHIVDLLVWYLGDPVEIKAHANTLHRKVEVEDVATATLRFRNGALATIAATTTAAKGAPHRVEVYGTEGFIQIEGEGIVRWELVNPDRQTVTPPNFEKAASAGAGSDPRGISAVGHTAIIKDLIVAHREGRDPVSTGEEAIRSLAVVNGIYRAAGLLV